MTFDATPASASGDLEWISFRIDSQDFCLDIMAVREIRGWTVTTPLPHSPPFVCGVINLRGAVLPVIDLKARLGLGEAQPTARSVIIVAHIGRRLVGLLVDAVSEILSAPPEAIQPTPNVASTDVHRFIKGILPLDGRMISWIALDALMPDGGLEEAA